MNGADAHSRPCLAATVERLARRHPNGLSDASSHVGVCILIGGQSVTGYRVVGGAGQRHRLLVEASSGPDRLRLTVPLDAHAIRQLAAAMKLSDAPADTLSPVGADMTDSVLRFLAAHATDGDRAVLAPLYAREIAYRVLQGEQGARLADTANHRLPDPMGDTIDYIATHLAEPLSVETLANRVHLSPSAFSRVFRDATGSSPYQYVKHARLQRARELLADGVSVSRVAHRVGFVSISHFIKQFRASFGITPGAYPGSTVAAAHRSTPAGSYRRASARSQCSVSSV